MSVVASNAFNLTVTQLKDILKSEGLSMSGNKAKLIQRLLEVDPSGEWCRESIEDNDEDIFQGNGSRQGNMPVSRDREIALYKREKELVERELALARREIELLQKMQQIDNRRAENRRESFEQQTDLSFDSRRDNLEVNRSVGNIDASAANEGRVNEGSREEQSTSGRTSVRTKINITRLADLLSSFNDNAEMFQTWERQVMFLKDTYKLDDDTMKVLIGTRLKGKAMEWFHSKPDYIALFPKDEILSYIIHGISDTQLHDVACLQGFKTSESLLHAFEEISLSDRSQTNSIAKGDSSKRKYDKSASVKNYKDGKGASSEKKDNFARKRCFNCGLYDHLSMNCPTKSQGAKYFGCGEHGHIAAKCPKKLDMKKSSCAVTQSKPNKFDKSTEMI